MHSHFTFSRNKNYIKMNNPESTLDRIKNSSALSITSYCLSSILMTVTNKYVVSGSFNLFFVLLAVQSFVCLLTLFLLKVAGFIVYRNINKNDIYSWIVVSLFLVLMVYSSSKALKYLSIPIYTIFKNLTIIIIAYGEKFFYGDHTNVLGFVSFILILFSSTIAYLGDVKSYRENLTIMNTGYIWMIFNCFCSAAYVLLLKNRMKITAFKDFDSVFYNNLLTLPLFIAFALLFDDLSIKNLHQNFPAGSILTILTLFIFSGLSSIFISYSSIWCVRQTSSTTYSMVGALNKLPLAVSGMIFMHSPINFYSVSSILIGFLAGLLYAVSKNLKRESETMLPAFNSSASISK